MPGKILLIVFRSVMLATDVLASTSRLYFFKKELGRLVAGMFVIFIFSLTRRFVGIALIIVESDVAASRFVIVSADPELTIYFK